MTGTTSRRLAVASVLTVGAAALSALLTPAAAQAAGAEIRLCSWVQAPTGFVDVLWTRDSSCPGSGLDNNAHVARYIAGDPVGTYMQACTSSPLPTGWFADGAGFFTSTCQTQRGGLPPNTVWITRLY